MISIPSATEVLIVGVGPTGLALAAELWRFGVKSVTIDKLVEGANTSRAAIVHARTRGVNSPSWQTRSAMGSALFSSLAKAMTKSRTDKKREIGG